MSSAKDWKPIYVLPNVPLVSGAGCAETHSRILLYQFAEWHGGELSNIADTFQPLEGRKCCVAVLRHAKRGYPLGRE